MLSAWGFGRGNSKFPNAGLPSAFTPSQPSRLAAPFASSASSSNRKSVSVRITFDSWDKGGIFDWYNSLHQTTFRKLELRKERDQFKHEFVVIYLEDKSVYRVDRRPLGPTPEVIADKGCEAEDSITGPLEGVELRAIDSNTDAEIVLEFPTSKPDLYTIIAVCVGIQMDRDTKPYTLQLHNCYFLARSITTIVTRYHLLQQSFSSKGLRWDRVTEPTISQHIFGADWHSLDAAMKSALITILDQILWPVVQSDAETRITEKKDWKKLEDIMKFVIREVIGPELSNLVGARVKNTVCHWIIQSTQATLWRSNLRKQLSEAEYKRSYEEAVEEVMGRVVRPNVETNLPSRMTTKLGDVLPGRLIHRLPPSVLAKLPAELLSRAPAKVLRSLPDSIFPKLPGDLIRKAPDEFLHNLPPETFAHFPTSTILTLPDDLERVPDGLRKVSLQRVSDVLDDSTHPDRGLALKLLRRLPDDLRANLDAKYIAMSDECPVDNPEVVDESDVVKVVEEGLTPEITEQKSHKSVQKLRTSLKKMSILGLLIQATPHPVLERLSPNLTALIPNPWLRSLPPDALARFPPRFLAKLKGPCLERLPTELLANLPETLLQKLPRATLEQLPESMLERLPMELIRNIPPQVLENLPEDLSDLLRQAITADTFKGPTVRAELARQVGTIMEKTLLQSRGDLPDTIIRVSVKKGKAGDKKVEMLKTHEALQAHILDMIRKHSKKVAQVARFGLGEEVVYSGLWEKTEEIWQVMRFHGSHPSR